MVITHDKDMMPLEMLSNIDITGYAVSIAIAFVMDIHFLGVAYKIFSITGDPQLLVDMKHSHKA